MKFHLFHLMPYADADMNFREKGQRSLWLLKPNDDYVGEKGRDLYHRYLDELQLAEEVGFDGVCVNEHHQTQYSMMPSPMIIAGALTQRIKKAKLLILGRALPLAANPANIAEEFAMIDNMSGGRLICGFVRGIGTEYHASTVNPAYSLERFREAHDIIVRAWTEAGPFAHEGKHFRFPYINIFPRPFQKPHPPIWIPSSGSSDSLETAVQYRYTYVQFFSSPYENLRKNLKQFRELARTAGYEASDSQLGWAVPIYVAETEEIARRDAKPHIESLFNDFLAQTQEMLLPPGYVSLESARSILENRGRTPTGTKRRTMEELIDLGIIIVGSYDAVRERLLTIQSDTGLGNLLPLLQFGTLPADLTRKNTELFAKHVMSPIRERLGVA